MISKAIIKLKLNKTFRLMTYGICILSIFLYAIISIKAIAAVPSQPISQIPLTIATPSHPQVLIAIGNSQSMDGTLSGSIMTGSGSLGSSLSSLNNTSSPVNYTVPANFIPPAQGANAFGQAPYTVNQSGTLIDNSASRLNMAKAGIQAIIQSYMATTDFALEDYSTSGTSLYTTWVYYMSPDGSNFTFTNLPISGNRYVNNPCFNYTLASSTVKSNCTSMATLFGATTLASNLYIKIDASSDDPDINDVLYASPSNIPGVMVSYTGPSPTTPYPPNFSLSNYNNGSILISYSKTLPNIGGFATSPTNAGFVPYSQQVMYAERGFGYGASQSATSGDILVPMTSAGTTPTTSSITTAINAFSPFLLPETNKVSSTEIKSVAGQAPTAGLLAKALSYLNSLSTTTSGGCPQKKYVILISDGLPTQDLNGKFWPPLGSAAAQGYGVTATFNADGSLNTTNDKALTDTINTLTSLKNAGINTYIIGLGAGVARNLNPQAAATLTAMAMAGGTNDYYPATDPQALVNDLNNILLSVQNGSVSVTAAAVSSTHLQSGTVEYQASFTSADTPYQDWTGDLVELAINPLTGSPSNSPLWSAQTLLDTKVTGTGWLTNRLIATWNPTLNSTGDGVPFQWTNINATQQSQLQPTDTQGQNRLQYLRGNTALEKRNGGPFRNRSHILGDIVDSQVIYVGSPFAPNFTPSYINFEIAQANRQPMLYVGANDGLLHGFNALTGVESFAFIPNGVFSNLDNLTSLVYNQSHLFFVDGSPQSADVQFSNSSWHTLLVGGENAGGNSIYALDITNPGNFNTEANLASAVLWEFTDGDMGMSFSAPQIAQIAPANTTPASYAVFFGNGYNSPTNKAVLYAINPQTGQTISKIDLCAAVPGTCNASLPQGLSSVAIGNLDGLQGQPITQIYAGDLQGNLWAIDVSSITPSQWKARLLFQARDANGNPQPITTPPLVTLNPSYPRLQGLFVMFGTGQLLTQADLTTQQTQTIYGVWDKPNANTVYTRSNLQQQTLTLVTLSTSGAIQTLLMGTTNALNWTSKAGWYDNLPIPGQRVVTEPHLLNGAFITSLNTPPLTTCNGQFTSMFLELNFMTGGAFLRPQLDIDGNGVITSSDQYNGLYPVGIGLTPGFASAPTTIGPNQNNNMVKIITQSGGQQSTILDPNNTSRRIGWWQLQ